jgi:hypothetical protein
MQLWPGFAAAASVFVHAPGRVKVGQTAAEPWRRSKNLLTFALCCINLSAFVEKRISLRVVEGLAR